MTDTISDAKAWIVGFRNGEQWAGDIAASVMNLLELGMAAQEAAND